MIRQFIRWYTQHYFKYSYRRSGNLICLASKQIITETVIIFSGCNKKARKQGSASGCNAPTTNLNAPTKNLQNIKDEHANQPTKNVRKPTESTF